MTKKNKTTILVAIIALVVALSIAAFTIGCMETAKAEDADSRDSKRCGTAKRR